MNFLLLAYCGSLLTNNLSNPSFIIIGISLLLIIYYILLQSYPTFLKLHVGYFMLALIALLFVLHTFIHTPYFLLFLNGLIFYHYNSKTINLRNSPLIKNITVALCWSLGIITILNLPITEYKIILFSMSNF
ncbi:MAG: hypothetical protein ABIO44_09175, partial [Saprospiraceae bacterium]